VKCVRAVCDFLAVHDLWPFNLLNRICVAGGGTFLCFSPLARKLKINSPGAEIIISLFIDGFSLLASPGIPFQTSFHPDSERGIVRPLSPPVPPQICSFEYILQSEHVVFNQFYVLVIVQKERFNGKWP